MTDGDFEERQKALRAQTVFQREVHPGRAGLVKAPAPVIVRDLLPKGRRVGGQLVVEQDTTLECPVLERALAKTMDGVDRRFVESTQRTVQPREHLFPPGPMPGKERLQ